MKYESADENAAAFPPLFYFLNPNSRFYANAWTKQEPKRMLHSVKTYA